MIACEGCVSGWTYRRAVKLPALLLVVLAAVLALAPGAAAFGEPSGHIDGSVEHRDGPLIDSFSHNSGPIFAWTQSDSALEPGSTARGAADLTYTSTPLTVDARGNASANTGALIRKVVGNTTYNQEFAVTRPMQYSATGSLSATSTEARCCVLAEARLIDDDGNNVFRVTVDTGSPGQSVGASGILQPGTYALNVQASVGMGFGATASPNIAGAAQFDIDFAISDPPVPVEITSRPAATTADTSATFAFQTTGGPPPPGRFECALDGVGFTECASPKTFTALPLGDHRFQVRYKRDGAPAGTPVEATWKVVPGCPDLTVGLVSIKGCFSEREPGVFETEQDAWIGGFHIKPRPGGKLVVRNDPAAPFTAEGTGVDWVLGGRLFPAPLGELQPFVPDFAVSVNTAGTFERFVKLPLLEGLSTQVKVTWSVTPAGADGSKLEASVSMEELTKNLGRPLAGRDGTATSVGTLAAKVALTLTNGKPAEVAEGELEVPEYAVELKGTNPPLKEGFGGGKFKAKRVGDTVEWSGEVTMLFPWQGSSGTNQGSVTGRLFFTDFEMAGLGFGVSGFETPIGKSGWDLTGLEGDAIYRPSYSFNVGVKAQQHSSFAGDHLLKLTGNVKALKLAETDCATGKNPVEFVGTFNAPPLEAQKIGELKGQLLMCAYLQGTRNFAFEAGVSGDLTVDVEPFKKLFSATGSAKGWFSGFDFNLEGAYRFTAPVIGTIGADAVVSSEGYAVCGRYGFISAGIATNNWLEPPGDLTGCDFTPFRAVAGARAAGGGPSRVRIPAGQSAFGFAVRAADGAPRVRVTGPRGERFKSPADGAPLESSSALIHSIDELKTTYVYLRRPRAGAWDVEPLGGTAISRIETARQLPDPRVRARVRRRGDKVVVRWTSRRVPGQRIELVDRANGVATTIVRPTSKLRGRATFTPADPLTTRRTIEAVITQDGSPRPSIVAARYTLKAPKRPARVRKPRARRTSVGLAVRWRKARRAREYLVTISAGASVLTRTVTRRPRVTYTDPPAGELTVRITPRDRFGRSGRATTVTG